MSWERWLEGFLEEADFVLNKGEEELGFEGRGAEQ